MAREGNNRFCALLLELSNLTPLLPLVGPQTSSVLWATSQVIQPPIPSPRHSSSHLYFKGYAAPSCFPCCNALGDGFPQGYALPSLRNSAQKCLDSSTPVPTHTSSEDTLAATTAKSALGTSIAQKLRDVSPRLSARRGVGQVSQAIF